MKNRLFGLDVLRTLCAFYVIFYHYFFRSVAMGDYNDKLYESNIYFSYGWIGVQLFFTISGFVIYYSCKEANISKFLVSRILRLYPAYWISILVTLIFMFVFHPDWWTISPFHMLINFSMLQTFLGIKNIDGAYWTLAYELIFYFWMAIFIYFKKVEFIKIFLFLSTLLYIFTSIFEIYDFLGILNKILLLRYSAYFLVGIYLYEHSRGSFRNFLQTLVCIISIALELYTKTVDISVRSEEVLYPVISWFHYLVFILIFIFIIKFNHVSEKYQRLFVIIGSLSYPIYLIHQNIGYTLISYFWNQFPSFISIILSIIVVTLLSFLIAEYLEPAIRQRIKNILAPKRKCEHREDS
jgi:peptidoglycan/LPS O-acetylase OafA/YrhL